MVRTREASFGGLGSILRMGLRWDTKQIKKDMLQLCFHLQHLLSSVTLSSHTPNFLERSQSTKNNSCC